MKISNELLAAYAEGHVTVEERKVVRQYLAKHPQELESVVMMMDDDYELGIDENTFDSDVAEKTCLESSFDCCTMDSYQPCVFPSLPDSNVCNAGHIPDDSFEKRLDNLMNDLDC